MEVDPRLGPFSGVGPVIAELGSNFFSEKKVSCGS